MYTAAALHRFLSLRNVLLQVSLNLSTAAVYIKTALDELYSELYFPYTARSSYCIKHFDDRQILRQTAISQSF